jgi:hypothetical protein
MTKKNEEEWNDGTLEYWNIVLNKTILLGFSCTIPSFHNSRISASSVSHFDIPLTFGF